MTDEGVSIVMPAFNAGQTIQQAIQSVLDQTHQRWELIVIDDGSHDDTAAIVRGFGEAVRYHRQENAGPAVARNCGIRMSRFPWVAFLDADDLWLPEKLSTQLDVAGNSGAQAVYTNCRNFGDIARVAEFRSHPPMPSGDIFEDLLLDNFLTLSTVMIRREALQAADGFLPEMTGAEDWDLWLRLAADGVTFEPLAEPLVLYRWLDDSFSKNNERMTRMRSITVEKALCSSRGRQLRWKARREARANATATSAWFTSPSSPSSAAWLYLKASATSPWKAGHWKGLVRDLLRSLGSITRAA
ncbi:MAG: glycosyltransferase family 2 protein [Planctomycetaceae bacterium]|nr:glycosyltransferase family 2 protein [Planctomycetaceae bacterium]